MDIGKIVICNRIKLGWTQQELADRCGLHRSQITNIENGRHKPSVDRFEAILKVMGKRLVIE